MKCKNYIQINAYRLSIFIIVLSCIAFIACTGNTHSSKGKEAYQQHDSAIAPSNKLILIGELNQKIKETSALAVLGDYLITHNDKGRTNELFLLNPENGNIFHSITISNINNNDWEDVAKSEEYLFIGDMGNNEGERKNLAIHLIPLKELNKNNTAIKSIGSINFYYPEQTEFDVSKKHNFDCEAILYHNQQIFLFTKNRLDNKTNLYVLPAQPGNYAAKLIGSVEVEGRITGADISPDGKRIALVGYNKKSDCFLWTFESFESNNFFNGKSQKYNLGQYAQIGQMEGIAFKDNSNVYLSSEEIANVHARLYQFKID
jgi:hypothetical protein